MKGGVVVESLLDGKRMPAYTTHKILALEDISIYTDENDVPLSEVFALMFDKSNGKSALDPKNASISELSDHLASVLPNYDRERVYNSDLKKLFQWFNLLVESGLLIKEEEKPEEKSSSKKPAAPKSAKQEKTEAPKPKSEPKGKKGSTKKVKK
ncbi:MAG: hypothetical protein RL266_86 [Bacteroidota bacterium]